MSPFTPPPRLATAPPRWHPPTSTVSAAVAPGILAGPPSMAVTVGATVAAPLLSLLPFLLPPPLLPWFIRTLLVSPTTSTGSGFLAGLPPALPCLWDSSTYSSRSRRGGATARTRPTGDFPRPTERTLHSGTGARWGRGGGGGLKPVTVDGGRSVLGESQGFVFACFVSLTIPVRRSAACSER